MVWKIGRFASMQRFFCDTFYKSYIWPPELWTRVIWGKVRWCMMYDMFVYIRGNPTLYNEALVDQIRICSASTV